VLLDAGDAVVVGRERLPAVAEHIEQAIMAALVSWDFGVEVAEDAVDEATGRIWGRRRGLTRPSFLSTYWYRKRRRQVSKTRT